MKVLWYELTHCTQPAYMKPACQALGVKRVPPPDMELAKKVMS